MLEFSQCRVDQNGSKRVRRKGRVGKDEKKVKLDPEQNLWPDAPPHPIPLPFTEKKSSCGGASTAFNDVPFSNCISVHALAHLPFLPLLTNSPFHLPPFDQSRL